MVLLHPNQLALLDRIHQYHQAGWISSDRVREFNRRVENKEPSDSISRDLGQILRTTATATTTKKTKQPQDPTPRHNGKIGSNYEYSTAATGGGGGGRPTPITTPADAPTIPVPIKHKKQKKKKRSTSSSNGSRTTVTTTSKPSTIVWDPMAWGQQHDPKDIFLDELFVELCFFARLLYYQPPCCLACAYQHRSLPTKTCNRWVVWRKNANIVFHPDTIHENIVILSCGLASRLLQGEVVGGWKWNLDKKELLRVKDGRL